MILKGWGREILKGGAGSFIKRVGQEFSKRVGQGVFLKVWGMEFSKRVWQGFFLVNSNFSNKIFLFYMTVKRVSNNYPYSNACSTTGKPTHLFRTKCASLDSV